MKKRPFTRLKRRKGFAARRAPFEHCDMYRSRKVAYRSADDAYAAREHSTNETGVALVVYHCAYGNHWHLSHRV